MEQHKKVNLDKLKELAEHLTPGYLETLHELGGSHVRELLELLDGVFYDDSRIWNDFQGSLSVDCVNCRERYTLEFSRLPFHRSIWLDVHMEAWFSFLCGGCMHNILGGKIELLDGKFNRLFNTNGSCSISIGV